MAFFFHVNAYACDFSPASIAGYRAFLAEQVRRSLARLNAATDQPTPSFADVDAAATVRGDARRQDIPWYTDWIEYRERYLDQLPWTGSPA